MIDHETESTPDLVQAAADSWESHWAGVLEREAAAGQPPGYSYSLKRFLQRAGSAALIRGIV